MAKKLEVWKIAAGAFLIPWRNRRQLMLALANPILLIAVLSLSWSFAEERFAIPSWLSWGLYLLYLVLFTMLAVTCHRLVLLNLSGVHSFTSLRWSRRESRFLLWLSVGYLVFIVITMVLGSVIGTIVANLFYSKQPYFLGFDYVVLAVNTLAAYLLARVCILLPAIAVDKEVTLKWAWNLTKNNGWRLVVIAWAFPWAISELIGLFYREGATVIETVVITIIWSALFVVEITAISLSYYELTKAQN